MRRTELDLCRILGCLGVLVIHAGADIYHEVPVQSTSFILLNLISTGVRGSVPLFFMLSGALFLPRETLDSGHMLRHALRLTGLYYLWSLVYALLRAAGGSFESVSAFFYAVVAGHYHLWFLPAMVLCYLFLPPVHAAVHGGGLDARWLTGLFFFLCLFLANCNLTPEAAPILHRFTLNFSLDYLPYLGYAIWGWRLAGRKLPKKTLWLAPLAYAAVTVIAARANRWYSDTKGAADGWLFSYFSLPSFLQATCVFCLFLALRDHCFRHPRLIAALADATLGVYLIHPLAIHALKGVGLAPAPAAPVTGLAVMFAALVPVCFIPALIGKKIPLLRRIL